MSVGGGGGAAAGTEGAVRGSEIVGVGSKMVGTGSEIVGVGSEIVGVGVICMAGNESVTVSMVVSVVVKSCELRKEGEDSMRNEGLTSGMAVRSVVMDALRGGSAGLALLSAFGGALATRVGPVAPAAPAGCAAPAGSAGSEGLLDDKLRGGRAGFLRAVFRGFFATILPGGPGGSFRGGRLGLVL